MNMRPLYLLSLPGLTQSLLERGRERASAISALAKECGERLLIPVVPAWGAISQATLLSGVLPQDHGVCTGAEPLGTPTFWQRTQQRIKELSVCAALWDSHLKVNTQQGPVDGTESRVRNGEFVKKLLQGTACDVTAIRMKGIWAASQEHGPDSEQALHRLERMDNIVAAFLAKARERNAALCITGEHGVNLVKRRISSRTVFDALGPTGGFQCYGQVGFFESFFPEPEEIAEGLQKARKIPGIARVVPRAEFEEIGLNHPECGEYALFCEPDTSFEPIGPSGESGQIGRAHV